MGDQRGEAGTIGGGDGLAFAGDVARQPVDQVVKRLACAYRKFYPPSVKRRIGRCSASWGIAQTDLV